MNTDGRDLQLSGQGPPIERLDILELVNEAEPACIDSIMRERIEHECIVGIRAVPHANRHRIGTHSQLSRTTVIQSALLESHSTPAVNSTTNHPRYRRAISQPGSSKF